MVLVPSLVACLGLAACAAAEPEERVVGKHAAPLDTLARGASPYPGTPAWSPDSLERRFGVVATGLGGEIGIAVVHVETRRRAAWNGDRHLPMASVYKLPIALEILRQVDAGAVSLNDSVIVQPTEFVGGANPMTASAAGRPVTATVGRMLEYMLTESDNTASDALLRLVGGPASVRDRLNELGIHGIDVSRYEAEVFAIAGDAPDDGSDTGDMATASALVELLVLVQRGLTSSVESRRLLLELLGATRLGRNRLPGLLPAGTRVAHKTGTFGPVTNDVGIVELPDGTNLAIAVLVRAPGTSLSERERAIAEIARAAYDAFAPPVETLPQP